MIYSVYTIQHNNKIIYIGRTNNLKRREKEHIRALNNPKHKQHNKELYKWLREQKTDVIQLLTYKEFKSKVESKRLELFLILQYHFSANPKQLRQTIPAIKDGWN